MTRIPDPSACAWCDKPARGHDEQFFLYDSDRHPYQPPRNRLIKDRMVARRAARMAARNAKPAPVDPATIVTITADLREMRTALAAVTSGLRFLVAMQALTTSARPTAEDVDCARQGILNLATEETR